MATPYEGYDVLEKWSSPSFDDQTRDALAQRLGEIPPRRFFSREELSTLEAIVERLAPPLPGLEASLLSLWIDDRLHRGSDEGFRSEGAPPAHEAWQRGLAAIEGEARRLFGASFATLDAPSKEAALHAVQAGETDEGLWDGLGAASFFSDTLLKTIAGLAYAHPLAWNDIGFGGPASPRGYVRLGFDARDPWEAKKRR
ncbi:gluconate 2-dehydrogenase subunit 3 family protein [Methylocystis parvus]|uniref:Gluconate 2-dehydrogenase subunit 3 family protein n=1 Tax=Methylocystis parvus TaxID=134 RepID=A0A6B8M672_9HYPH|nr:gluconate 2-dehydrogenase subunit 3 family protein [Methylocystis parvus]